MKEILENHLAGIEEETLEYFEGIVSDADMGGDFDAIKESLAPLLEAYGFAECIEAAEELCAKICQQVNSQGIKQIQIQVDGDKNSSSDEPVLLDKTMSLGATHVSAKEQAAIDSMWGFDKIRSKKNDIIETTEAASARYERNAEKEQKRWLEELEAKFIGDDESPDQISTMTLPDYSSNNREKDIQVSNFNINFAGQLLLDSADLRLTFGRRYGLVGKNGVGKTTLLKHMASFDIEGFPRHHRVLHVKQEVKSSEETVLEVVMKSDVREINSTQGKRS